MSRVTWLPWLARTSIPEEVEGQAPCALSEGAATFVALWLAVLGARAPLMVCDHRLVRCAQDHAAYLAGRQGAEQQQSMHVGRGGSAPNQRVLDAGYRLPFSAEGNSVESCAWNWQGPQAALERLLASPGHRPHLLGEGFWEASVVYGVGVAGDAYVVVTCPRES